MVIACWFSANAAPTAQRGPAASTPVAMISFGAPGDVPIVGRWTGTATTYVGVYRPSTSTFFLRTQNASGPADRTIQFGAPGDIPLVGRWCRGKPAAETPAVYRAKIHSVIFQCGAETSTIPFGTAGDVPIAGDWWGTGYSTIGVYRPSQQTFFLSGGRSAGLTIRFGAALDRPVVRHLPTGSVVGVHRPSIATFYLRESHAESSKIITIPFGATTDVPLIGDWTGDGVQKIGVYRPHENVFYLKNSFP